MEIYGTACDSKRVKTAACSLLQAVLHRRLAKVVTQQNTNRNRGTVALRGKKVELSCCFYDRLVQAVTGPAHNLDATHFAARVDVDQDINGGFNFSVSRALRIRRLQSAIGP